MAIEMTFDGNFVINNKVSMRTLAQTYLGMQKALERAYLDIERGGISKYETIRDEDRRATEFYLESYREGSFISVFKAATPILKRTIDRLSSTINDRYSIAIKDGDIEHQKIIQEAKERLLIMGAQPINYEDALNDSSIYIPKQYARKSMLNHFSDSLVPIKKNDGENSINYRLAGDSSYEFYFDANIATRFTRSLQGKELGSEIKYESYVIRLDGNNQKGVIRHKFNNKEATIFFINYSDYNIATEYLKQNEASHPLSAMRFIGYAIKELNALDLANGDIIFKALVKEENG